MPGLQLFPFLSFKVKTNKSKITPHIQGNVGKALHPIYKKTAIADAVKLSKKHLKHLARTLLKSSAKVINLITSRHTILDTIFLCSRLRKTVSI